jgi:hippurate hydrolase
MPVLNRIADLAPEMAAWRQHLHRNPELKFACHKTAGFVAERLREFGVDEIHEGIAETGIVAVIEGQGEGPTIGLRADMDALPIAEETGLDYASATPGVMHACGHDGHTAMLLGAAKYLAETRRFRGKVALIFQPAEEDGGGGQVMVEEGILDRFGIAEVYALHNTPKAPLGCFVTTPGPIMAAVDTASVTLTGRGGHGAYPHDCIDPVPAVVAIAATLQTIVSRNVSPLKEAVVSVTEIHAGTASNIIPETARLTATIRSFDPEVRLLLKRRFHEIVAGIAAAHEVRAEITYEWGYPATVNDAGRTHFATSVAAEIVGEARVVADGGREMGAEDFSYLLDKRPGCYLFLGQGTGAGLHHPAYNFNDEAAPFGASFFARLVERAQPL